MHVLASVGFALGLLGAAVSPAAADSWLDQPAGYSWNTPGMDIPTPVDDPHGFQIDPACVASTGRDVDNAHDQAVVDAGWTLFGERQMAFGIDVVSGTAGYDGMCRPMGYHAFVFVGNAFAGTISPDAMASRLDGAGQVVGLVPDGVIAQFARYTDSDPLCCPSSIVTVQYAVVRRPGGPILATQSSTVASPN